MLNIQLGHSCIAVQKGEGVGCAFYCVLHLAAGFFPYPGRDRRFNPLCPVVLARFERRVVVHLLSRYKTSSLCNGSLHAVSVRQAAKDTGPFGCGLEDIDDSRGAPKKPRHIVTECAKVAGSGDNQSDATYDCCPSN